MITNICRPFTLYNDYIPPVDVIHRDWRYFSFGYYDGFNTEGNIFQNGEYNLQSIWKYCLKQSEALKGSYLSQTLYGLRAEEPNDEAITDNEFWNNNDIAKEYPFIFLSLIQIDGGKEGTKGYKSGWEKRREFEQKLNKKDDYRAIVYMSFDNSDIIMVVRSKSYTVGAKLVDSLHSKENILKTTFDWKIKYSFTVASFNNEAIDDKYFRNNQEKIPKVMIYLLESYPGGIDDYLEYIKEWSKDKGIPETKIEDFINSRHSVLGCNDEVFEIRDMVWGDFLELYREQTGVFNSTNQEYRKYINSITTIIGIKK